MEAIDSNLSEFERIIQEDRDKGIRDNPNEMDSLIIKVISFQTLDKRREQGLFHYGYPPAEILIAFDKEKEKAGRNLELEFRFSVYIEEEDGYYKGQWIKDTDIRLGKGMFLASSGDLLEGWWFKNKLEGRGRIISDDFYEGQVKSGLPHGFGKKLYANGNCYEGDFKNNLYNGEGNLLIQGEFRYEGSFEKGKKHGFGMSNH